MDAKVTYFYKYKEKRIVKLLIYPPSNNHKLIPNRNSNKKINLFWIN